IAGQQVAVTVGGSGGTAMTLSLHGGGLLISGRGSAAGGGGYLFTFGANGFGASARGQKLPLAKVLEKATEQISAASGGTITLPAGVIGSVPMADVVDLTGTHGFAGIPGDYDPGTHVTALNVPAALTPDGSTIYTSTANFDPATLRLLPPPPLGGRLWHPSLG